jgi:hypothetical protein
LSRIHNIKIHYIKWYKINKLIYIYVISINFKLSMGFVNNFSCKDCTIINRIVVDILELMDKININIIFKMVLNFWKWFEFILCNVFYSFFLSFCICYYFGENWYKFNWYRKLYLMLGILVENCWWVENYFFKDIFENW